MSSFFGELKRRNVVRVGLAYAIVGWLLLEVASLMFDAFKSPEWVLKAFIGFVILGFPIAVIFAWAFELTPEGLKRTHEVPADESVTPSTGRKLDFVIIGVMAVALVYFVITHDWGSEDGVRERAVTSASIQKSIAVLPFDNFSDNQENAFFASGVHEDILTLLSKVHDLRVISRTSVERYATDRPEMSVIAENLGVAHIVEGSVRRAGDRVRITAQLINASTDEHIWAESYDRDLTDVFEIQTEVATEIVTALKANLSPEEQAAIAVAPTRNVAAYDYFLKAREIDRESEYSINKYERMEPLLDEAIRLDDQFALAYTMLAQVYGQYYWLGKDISDERLQLMKAAIDRAFTLQPEIPEARAALADYYYRGFNDFARSLQELRIVYEKYPNNADTNFKMAMAERRLGLWDDAIGHLLAGSQLDPLDMQMMMETVGTMQLAHKYAEAAELLDRLIRKYPDNDDFKILRASTYLNGSGDIPAARTLIEQSEKTSSFPLMFQLAQFWILARDYERAADVMYKLADQFGPVFPWFSDQVRGNIAYLSGKTDEAMTHFENGKEKADQFINDFCEECRISSLIEFNSYLGDRDEVMRLARILFSDYPIEENTVDRPGTYENVALAMARVGETEAGLDLLETLVDQPGASSKWALHLHPSWDFMRDNERFAALTTPDGVARQ